MSPFEKMGLVVTDKKIFVHCIFTYVSVGDHPWTILEVLKSP